MDPAPPSTTSDRRKTNERPRKEENESKSKGSRRRQGHDSSSDSAPEVEFGAFRRRPVSSLGQSSSTNFYQAKSESRPVIANGKPVIPAGKMRAGAPRLGGLGLGGLANQQTEVKRTPSASVTRSASTSTQKVRRKAPATTRYPDEFPVRAPPTNAFPAPLPMPPSPSLPLRSIEVDGYSSVPLRTKRSMPNIERPFLSPEMPVTTVRSSAFALNRPVPDSGMRQPVSIIQPDSPPLKDFTGYDDRRDSIGSNFTHEETRSEDAEEERSSFGLLQAALAEDSRSVNRSMLVTPEIDQSELSFPSSPMDPTPPTARPRFEPMVMPGENDVEEIATPTPLSRSASPLIPVEHRSGSSSSEESHPPTQSYRSSASSAAASDTTDSAGPRTPPPLLHYRQASSSPLVHIVNTGATPEQPKDLGNKTPVLDSASMMMQRQTSLTSSIDSYESGLETQIQVALHVPIPFIAAASRLSGKNRGPAPPRPKRLRVPAINMVVDAAKANDEPGSYESPISAMGIASQLRLGLNANGSQGSSAGSSTETSRKGSAENVRPISDPPSLPLPSLPTSDAEEHEDIIDFSRDRKRRSPEMPNSPASFLSSEAGSGNESFFYRAPPARNSTDQSIIAAPIVEDVPESSIVNPSMRDLPSPPSSPPLVATPVMSPIVTSIPVVSAGPRSPISPVSPTERPVAPSYFGLGLRLPSSLTPSSVSSSRSSIPDKATPVPSLKTVTPPPLEALPAPPAPPTPMKDTLPAQKKVAIVREPSPVVDLPLPAVPAPVVVVDVPVLAPVLMAPLPPVVARPPSPVIAPRQPSPVRVVTPPPIVPVVVPIVPEVIEEQVVKPKPESTVTTVALIPTENVPNPLNRSYSAAAASLAVSGGIALGYGAWRGLATAASVGGSSLSWGWKRMAEVSEVPVSAEPVGLILEPFSPTVRSLCKRKVVVPGSFGSPITDSDTEDDAFYEESEAERSTLDEVDFERDDRSSSVIETEWGEMHFPAPDGFLEDFKRAMEEVGPEDFARAEQEAQDAAYAAATLAHEEIDSPTTNASTTLPKMPTSPVEERSLQRMPSSASSRTLRNRQRAEEANEMEELADQFSINSQQEWPSPATNPRRLEIFPSTNSSSPSPSSRSISSTRSSTLTPSSSKGSLFGFGSMRRKRVSSDAASNNTPMNPLQRTDSVLSSTSSGSASKRSSSIFGGAPKVSPPSVESDIGDATYVSYSSGKSKRRQSSAASFVSREGSPAFSIVSDANSIRRERRSSLRRESRYDTSKLILGDSIAELAEPARKSVYSVRFANAIGGSGLRSVAESEAERKVFIDGPDESTDQAVQQVLRIKNRWRTFPAKVDWNSVRID